MCPAGSSGGSASAVAAHQAPFSLGSDTGGSIRQPAALCGIVGMKPTYGAVSRYGLIAFASSLDQVGPFARTVRDAALVLRHMVGHDPHGLHLARTGPSRSSCREAERLDGLRVGYVEELMGEGVEPGVRDAVRRSLDLVEDLGGDVGAGEPADAPSTASSTYYLIAPAECSANLARFDGIRYGCERRRHRRPAGALRAHARRRASAPR